MIEDILDNPQHHAYLVFGTLAESIQPRPGRGLYVARFEKSISVEEVRWLHDYAHQSVGTGTRKVVLGAPGISFQAQNALLKIIEETQQSVYFFIFLPSGTNILDTLLSRCYIIETTDGNTETASSEFEKFITASPKKRLEMIDIIWNQGESARHITILRLLQDFEKYLHRCVAGGGAKDDKHTERCRRATENFRDAIYNGALHKGTLQVLALV